MNTKKHHWIVVIITLGMMLSTSCTPRQRATAVGAVTGAGLGALVGGHGNRAEGAIIGGIVGGIAGSAVAR